MSYAPQTSLMFPNPNQQSQANMNGFESQWAQQNMQTLGLNSRSRQYSQFQQSPLPMSQWQEVSSMFNNPFMTSFPQAGNLFGGGFNFTPFPSIFTYSIQDMAPSLMDPRFINNQVDQQASNGVFHAIDEVLLPFDTNTSSSDLSLADIFAASGGEADDNGDDFDLLKLALDAAGLTDALADPDADLTVLAPNDDAFISLANQLGSNATTEDQALSDILATLTALGNGNPLPLLTQILTYHVIPESRSYQNLVTRSEPVTTLNGEDISFYLNYGLQPFMGNINMTPNSFMPNMFGMYQPQYYQYGQYQQQYPQMNYSNPMSMFITPQQQYGQNPRFGSSQQIMPTLQELQLLNTSPLSAFTSFLLNRM